MAVSIFLTEGHSSVALPSKGLHTPIQSFCKLGRKTACPSCPPARKTTTHGHMQGSVIGVQTTVATYLTLISFDPHLPPLKLQASSAEPRGDPRRTVRPPLLSSPPCTRAVRVLSGVSGCRPSAFGLRLLSVAEVGTASLPCGPKAPEMVEPNVEAWGFELSDSKNTSLPEV